MCFGLHCRPCLQSRAALVDKLFQGGSSCRPLTEPFLSQVLCHRYALTLFNVSTGCPQTGTISSVCTGEGRGGEASVSVSACANASQDFLPELFEL